MFELKAMLKLFLMRWLLALIVGRHKLPIIEALTEDARREKANAFERRGYLYREIKRQVDVTLTVQDTNLAVELATSLDALVHGEK